MKSLIVEDEPTSASVLHAFLQTYGEAEMASNGQEAIDKFKAAIEAKVPFNLVCLDILMPGVDGKQVLNMIREFEKEQKIPEAKAAKIIMTTALSSSTEISDAFKHGCEAYIIKPIVKEKLISYLERMELIPVKAS